MLKIC